MAASSYAAKIVAIPNDVDVPQYSKWTDAWGLALFVFLFSLGVRLLYFVEVRNDPLLHVPVLDSAVYDQWAQEILKGDWLSRSRPVLALSPGYAYWRAIQGIVLGRGFAATAVVQFFLGAGTVLFVFALAFRLARNKYSALLCAMVYALYGPAVCYEAMPITAAWINFLNTLALLFVLSGFTMRNCWIAGLLIGLSSLFRPTVLLFAALFPLVVFLHHRENHLHSAKLMGRFLLGLVLPLGLFMGRNLIVAGEARFSAGSGSMNLFIGNSKYSNGTYVHFGDIESGNPTTQLEDYRRAASTRLKREVTMRESDAFWRQEAFRYMREHPLEWGRLEFRKLALLVSTYELGNNVSYYYFLEKSKVLRASALVTFPVLVFLAALGLWQFLKGGLKINTSYISILSIYCVSYVVVGLMFFVLGEYRFALVPGLLGLAAPGIGAVFLWVRSHSWRKLGGLAAAIAIATTIVHAQSKKLEKHEFRSKELAVAYTAAGDVFKGQGRLDESVSRFNAAIALDPSSPLAPIKLSAIYMAQRRYEDASLVLKRVILVNDKVWQIHGNLGICSFQLGRLQEAEDYLRTAHELYPSPENKARYLMLRSMKK